MRTLSKYNQTCFSGDCGMCKQCLGNIHEKDTESEIIDSFPIFYKDQIKDISKNYWEDCNQLLKKKEYFNPKDKGYIHNKFKIDTVYGKLDYCLIEDFHNHKCQDLMCQLIYNDTHEYLRKKLYSKLPIYERSDKLNYLCYPCIMKQGYKNYKFD